jgi:hypothetical protein
MLAVLGAIAGQTRKAEGLEYLSGSVVIEDSGTNSNGKLEPGETVNLSVSLINEWADATNVQATLSCGDSLASIAKATASFGDVGYGDVTDNSADAFVVSLDSSCPGTYTLEFTLEVTAEGPYSYAQTSFFRYAVMVDQEGYDDGEADAYYNVWSPHEGMAVRMTPETYPCSPTHIRLFSAGSEDCNIIVQVWDDNGPDGVPGTVLAGKKIQVSGRASGEWLDVDISSLGVRIDGGSFYLGFSGSDDTQYVAGVDTNPPYSGRSWSYGCDCVGRRYWDNITWANLMVRVRYVYEVEDGPVENTSSGKKYNYIRHAIFEAESGDEIVLEKGVYHENVSIHGKDLRIRSTNPDDPGVAAATVIAGGNEGPTVAFSGRIYENCGLAGLTITGGAKGIYCVASCPAITKCNIIGSRGSGIEWETSLMCRWPTITNCSIVANDGNGIEFKERGNPSVINCIVSGNLGHGVCGRRPKLVNCTVVGNMQSGVSCLAGEISNCIIWDNGQSQVEGAPMVWYSDIEGGWQGEGEGNIDVDPCFVEAGRWQSDGAGDGVTAWNPSPADGATDVGPDMVLSWSAGRDASGHSVYFGTDLDDVSEATTRSSVYVGRQDGNSWDPKALDPCGLAAGTTYYWRVDEVNDSHADSPWKGRVWRLQTRDANLVGWWELDEGEGSAACDSSGYGNDGTITGEAYWAEGLGAGHALEFEGGRVLAPDANELRPRKELTVSAWVNYGQAQEIFARVAVKGADNYETFSMEIYDDRLLFSVRDEGGGRYSVWSWRDVGHNEWAHVAGSYDGTYQCCYIDGELQEKDYSGSMTLSQDATGLAIGNAPDVWKPFVGKVDDVRVYDRGLSADEVGRLCSEGVRKDSQWVVYNDGDYHLRADSRCIDAGKNMVLPGDTTDLDGDGNTAEPIPCDLEGACRCIDYGSVPDTGSGTPPIVDMGAYEAFVPPLKVSLAFTPQSLNPSSKGNWVKAHLALPEGVGMADVNAAGVRIIEPFEIEPAYVNIFGNKYSSVKIEAGFDRADFCGRGPVEGTIAVEGLLADGRRFRGEDTIKVSSNVFEGLVELAAYWLAGDCGPPDWCGGADIDRNSAVNFGDFVVLGGCCIEFTDD